MLGARDGRRRAGHTPHSRMLVVGVVAMCKKQRLDDVCEKGPLSLPLQRYDIYVSVSTRIASFPRVRANASMR